MPEVTGLMIIRTWMEPGSIKPLRAQVRFTTDVSIGFEQNLTFVDIPAVSGAVETWLMQVVAMGEQVSAC